MNIGAKIKQLRKEKDLTQEQLAEYLNVSISAVSQWESGKTLPDLSLILPLANFLMSPPTRCSGGASRPRRRS